MRAFWTDVDQSFRSLVCAMLVLIGYTLTHIAQGFILTGAWIADVDVAAVVSNRDNDDHDDFTGYGF